MSYKRLWHGAQEQDHRQTRPRLSGSDWNRGDWGWNQHQQGEQSWHDYGNAGGLAAPPRTVYSRGAAGAAPPRTAYSWQAPASQPKGKGAAQQSKGKGHWNRGRHVGQYLVIMDMNGVLMKRSGSGNHHATMRPHLQEFLKVLSELSESFSVAVWSSMMMHNLSPMVDTVFGDLAASLQFIWDQNCCTKCWVPEMRKPLFRKDLAWLNSTQWASYMPDRVLLIDDDAIKCTENPKGTAIHPSSFEGGLEGDDELLHLAEYLKTLAETADDSVPEFVTSHPYDDFKSGRDMPSWQCEDTGTVGADNELAEVEIEGAGDMWVAEHEPVEPADDLVEVEIEENVVEHEPVEPADDLVEVEIEENGYSLDAEHEAAPTEDDGYGSLGGAEFQPDEAVQTGDDKWATQEQEEHYNFDDHADGEAVDNDA